MSAKKQAAAEPVKKAPAGYTDEQLQRGRHERLAGESWVKVAHAAGVKSDGHFSRVLRARYPELAEVAATKPEPAPAEPAQGKPQAKRAKAESKPARRRRGAKAPTGEEG